jgi:GMP synthase (glutamine-hydrolysing)
MTHPSIRQFSNFHQWIALILVICAVLGALVYIGLESERRLRCLIVDLELEPSPVGRYTRLSQVISETIPEQAPGMAGVSIEVDCLHFTDLSRRVIDRLNPDFIVLSPQSTPWRRYRTQKEQELKRALNLTRSLANEGLPMIGICGGHQFLAMAFGGLVNFIDPAYMELDPMRYTHDMKCERGWTRLSIKTKDPIFRGIQEDATGFWARQWHCEEVKTVPEGMVNLAESDLSEVQVLRLKGKLVYGTAFHPEAGWAETPKGPGLEPNARTLLSNFLISVSKN